MWGQISNISALTGIIGVSFTNWLTDPEKAWASLGIFALFVIFAGYRVYVVSRTFLAQHYPKGYLSLSTATKYTTSDGKNIVYEVIRHIQVKKPVMTCFDHRFTWSGTKDPVIKSDLQNPSEIKPIDGENRKLVRMAFPQSRIYNDVEIVHILMELDDSDGKSSPHISQQIELPLRLISFDVELLHVTPKYFGEMAKLCRRAIDKGESASLEAVATVKFNAMTKSFFHQLSNPEPGFVYIFSWPEPPLPSTGRRRTDKPSWK